MVKARKYVVKKHFEGLPKRSDYQLVEYELPPLKCGEILLKTEWISVDPYLREHNHNIKLPYDQFSFHVGIVQESRDPNYPVGTRAVTHKGWCDYTIVNPNTISLGTPSEITWKVPELNGLSPSLAIGAIGMPGLSAYFGFLEICQGKANETVVVTAAAGAVGSMVGQLAKMKGCKVIGFTGSDYKVQFLENELGFNKALNYKKVDVHSALLAAAPNGVDYYFDNVGGEISSIIIGQMNSRGKVSVCGSICAYSDYAREIPKATMLQPYLIYKELTVEGFLVWRWLDRWPEAIDQMLAWIHAGQLKPVEHVTEGFDKIFDAFVGMLAGENTGKAVVKV